MEYEVLSPLGRLESLEPIISAGADAVYSGLYGFSSRPGSSDLSMDELRQAREITVKHGVKLFVAVNSFIGHTKIEELLRQIEQLDAFGMDAIVVADLGLLAGAVDIVKRMELHVSTLFGVFNAETVKALQLLRVSRMVLSTSLYLDEMRRIINEVPDMEYEIIASGGLCGNDNRQCELPHIGEGEGYKVACSFDYTLSGRFIEPRPAKPLALPQVQIERVLGQYMSLGIRSFKIEGRTLSTEIICKRTAHLRRAVDDFLQDSANFPGYIPYFSRA